jgi:hypothetical protein
MTSTFSERIDELRKTVGNGQKLSGSVVVDQIYAHYQHEGLNLHHPRGGGPKFLEKPLMDGYRDYLGDYARTVLADGGQPAMKRSAEHLSDAVELTAPVEFSDLRQSGHPSVTLGGRTVYDREPKVARLTAEELKAKSRLRWAGLPDALKGWIYWHNTARGKAGIPPRGSGWKRGGRK